MKFSVHTTGDAWTIRRFFPLDPYNICPSIFMYSYPTTSEILQLALSGILITIISAFSLEAADPSSSTTWTRSLSFRGRLRSQFDFSGDLPSSPIDPTAPFNSNSRFNPAELREKREPTARFTTTFIAASFANAKIKSATHQSLLEDFRLINDIKCSEEEVTVDVFVYGFFATA
jgi:hypothetical protein